MATSDRGSAGDAGFPDLTAVQLGRLAGDQTRTVFGQVMGLLAARIGVTALGAYIGRNLTGGTEILFFAPRLCLHLRSPVRDGPGT